MLWRSWHDRHSTASPQMTMVKTEVASPSDGIQLASFNINGFPSKREKLIEFLDTE